MNIDEQVLAELKAIRKAQEDLLAEHRQATIAAFEIQKQALDNQLHAVAQQTQAIALSVRNSRIWRVVISLASVLMIWLIFYLYRHT